MKNTESENFGKQFVPAYLNGTENSAFAAAEELIKFTIAAIPPKLWPVKQTLIWCPYVKAATPSLNLTMRDSGVSGPRKNES